ncbi:MAG: pilus assembly protein TadB [Peptococcaceae bacterium BICA1-7]|nr:MAG: pilus assembly protein TadB [Peptococcaceae bacterium BICA1-7]
MILLPGRVQDVECSCLTDYSVYVMSRREKEKYTLMGAAGLFIIAFVFFQSVWVAALFSPGGLFFPGYMVRGLAEKRKKELRLQFKDALYALSSALGSGSSVESAFRISLNDLRIIYPDEKACIIREFSYICRRIEMNEPVEKALADFGRRSHIEDISNFADVISICKRTGGNLVSVVKNTSGAISGKIEVEQEIELILAGRRYEQKVLSVMPLVFIGLVNFGGSGYTDTLYSSFTGYLLMALSLGILVASYLISKRIMDIKV